MSQYEQYYIILELQPNASSEEVKQAYRRLAKLWHPDRYPDNLQKQKEAEEKFKQILEAYKVLKDYQPQITFSTVTPDIEVKRSRPEIHYQEGIQYAEKELYQEAIEEFSAAIRLNSNYLEAYQYRGFILSKLGLEKRAEADFIKATELKLNKLYTDTFVAEKPSSSATPKTPVNSPKSSATPKTTVNAPWQCTHTLMSHTNSVSAIALSPDGKTFASASYDRTIKLWQFNPIQALFTLKGHTDLVRCLAISPDGTYLASGSKDKTIKVWDLKTKNVRTIGGRYSEYFSDVLTVAISPDGQTLISGSVDRQVKIWHLQTGKEIYTLNTYTASILSVAISPNGQLFASAGLEQILRIRDIDNGKVIRSIKGNASILSVDFSPNGELLASGGFDRTIKIWDLKTGRIIHTLEGHGDRVSSVAFSHDGQSLISGSFDKTIKIWQVNSGKEMATLKGHSEEVLSVAVSRDGKTIISGSDDNTIKVWQYKYI
jgi:WD40 repeat protein